MDSQQQSTTRQQEETNVEPQLNHKPQTEHEEPNSQPRLADFGLGISAHLPRSFCFPKRQFGKSKPIFRNVHVVWFDNLVVAAVRWRRRQGDLPHLYRSAQNTSADHVNARCSLYQTGRMPDERRLAFRSMKIWPVSPGNITLHATTNDVGEHISSAHEEDKANNRKPIMKLLSNTHFLSRQGIFSTSPSN